LCRCGCRLCSKRRGFVVTRGFNGQVIAVQPNELPCLLPARNGVVAIVAAGEPKAPGAVVCGKANITH
jgi:hypothetical protein